MARSLLIGVALLAGCAFGSQSGSGLYSLTPEALERTGARDLYYAIEELRPQWMNTCATVFRNDTYWGELDALHEFRPNDIANVLYIPKAHPRPGAGSTAVSASCPAIQVVVTD